MQSNASKLGESNYLTVRLSKYLTKTQNRAIRLKTGLDLTSALNTAFATAIAEGASSIELQDGEYVISGSGIVLTSPLVLIGTGPTKCIIRQTNASGSGVSFDYSTLKQGGGIRGITVEAGAGWQSSGFAGSGSTGVGILVKNANDLFFAEDFAVNNFDYSILTQGCYQTRWQNFRVLFFTARGIQVDKSTLTQGAGNLFAKGKVSNFGFTGVVNGSRGIDLQDGGGDFFETIDVTSCGNGVVVAPITGRQVLYPRFTNVLADTSVFDNWLFDGTNGKVWEVTCTACWGAYSTDGSGLKTQGSNLIGLQWNGGQLRENGLYGWINGGGSSLHLDTVRIVHNSKKTSNTTAGVVIAGGVSNWVLSNSRIGNDGTSTAVQADGIKIDAGVSQDFIVSSNDLRNPGAGKVGLANGSSTLSWITTGNLPLQAVGNNVSDSVSLNGTKDAVSEDATTSLGKNLVFRSGVLSQFYVKTAAAPGVGQSFTYTVYVNGSSTSMTAVISGTSTEVSAIANPQTLTKNDAVELRVTTSSGAAVTSHSFYLSCEP